MKRSQPDPETLPELKLLLLFDRLYDTRSVTRAAEQLGQSQPTVSIWLARLREQLRDPLFVRTPQGMQPTPRADALIGQTREVIEALRRLVGLGAGIRAGQRTAALSHLHDRRQPHHAAAATAGPLCARWRRRCGWPSRASTATPRRRSSPARPTSRVGHAPWLESGIYQQTLFAQDWVCLANPAHPRIGRTLSLRRYQAEAHITIAAGTGQQLLEDALAAHRVQRQVLLELPGFLGLGPIISTTDLIVTLPRHIGETLARLSGLAVFPCPLPVPSFDVKQHWHARYHRDAGNRWLRGVMAGLFMRGDKRVRRRQGTQLGADQR